MDVQINLAGRGDRIARIYRQLEPLQGLDTAGRVIYAGSFAKTMLPMPRGGISGGPRVAPARAAQCQAAHRLARRPHHAGRARAVHRGRAAGPACPPGHTSLSGPAERIEDTLGRDFAAWLQTVPSVAGLHLAAMLQPGAPADLDRVVCRAHERGVAVENLAGYFGELPARPGLVIGYGAIGEERIGPARGGWRTASRRLEPGWAGGLSRPG